ncbi:Mov34/MPN/PAD-1 family protein [Chloracidobacterium aggregatum]|jgi:proteasome lid subunit RPN8/RPN11|uniref:M67 family metallopeptidase n=1 Tax=Chloracidobacterium sp. N TaxID=2821540 RepID=A0ABX8B233_9BACT|nr:M67 family metallopeptidase [Chloracidobacterium aggregatum]QUV86115.1 M67 family metallopeptidase [Chloracidobacterium sp. 2]QUV89438.1 M67 family metallopeptidase [Chloracidobacterium sp. S]QUV92560.1 M67 family metallopeptidase [Chloracidobacterium sp. A]QUV95033.1 M67 family metallopeptidase [Chloracidobacterium sp. N]QUV98241.1 M67 family metallopeptidase [Chloracidobacterium sp. E]
MLVLTPEQEAAIRAHGEADYPYECCGLLLGTFAADGRKTTVEVMPISNAREESAKRNRFLITPQELMRGERYARSRQLDIIGFYHSHPDHPAVPSGYDLDHALPVYSYVIVSVAQGRAGEVQSWELEADRSRFNPESIVKG